MARVGANCEPGIHWRGYILKKKKLILFNKYYLKKKKKKKKKLLVLNVWRNIYIGISTNCQEW